MPGECAHPRYGSAATASTSTSASGRAKPITRNTVIAVGCGPHTSWVTAKPAWGSASALQVNGQLGHLLGSHFGGPQDGEHVAERLCGLPCEVPVYHPFGVGAVLAADVQGAAGLGDDLL